jgi:hypothetical protein
MKIKKIINLELEKIKKKIEIHKLTNKKKYEKIMKIKKLLHNYQEMLKSN